MIIEKADPKSGAILFVKDEESLALEDALKRIKDLESRIKKLEDELNR